MNFHRYSSCTIQEYHRGKVNLDGFDKQTLLDRAALIGGIADVRLHVASLDDSLPECIRDIKGQELSLVDDLIKPKSKSAHNYSSLKDGVESGRMVLRFQLLWRRSHSAMYF